VDKRSQDFPDDHEGDATVRVHANSRVQQLRPAQKTPCATGAFSGRMQPGDGRASRNESVGSLPVLRIEVSVLHIDVYRMDALAQCDLDRVGLEEATFIGRQVDDPVAAGQRPTCRMRLRLLDKRQAKSGSKKS
jgi:hypothetical protein